MTISRTDEPTPRKPLRLWPGSRNAATDTETELSGWGFSGSPLVAGDVVIVAAAGSLVAYDLVSGEKRWIGPRSPNGYSSPHLMTIGGVQQVVLLRGPGATGVAPADGSVLWEFNMPSVARIVQPALTEDGDVLLAVGEEGGLALVAATPERFTELARAPAIEGKTWNHPALVGDVLLVRNDREMAAFRLEAARAAAQVE